MQIKQFRYLTINDPVDLDFVNWSRAYEYKYILDELKKDDTLKTVHNTSCGGWQEVHQQFITKLNTLDKEVTNSDAVHQEVRDFYIYNILDKPTKKYDCVLNVSTIEDFTRYDMFSVAMTNLLEMTNKRFIATMDDNGIEVGFVQKFFDLSTWPISNHLTLRGGNSTYPNSSLDYLKIILLDVVK